MESIDIEALMDKYQRMQMMQQLGSMFERRYLKDPLDVEDRKLSILAHKRELGLPVSDDDYEDATNEGKSFYSHIAPSLQKRGLQAIPGPNIFGPKKAPLEPIFKIAEKADDLLMSYGIPLGRKANVGTSIGRFLLKL